MVIVSPPPAEAPQETRKLAQWARTAESIRDLANRMAGSSEETAALFDSGHRPQSELGEDPREDVA
jgi:catalase (peroxidase I)